MQDLTDTFRAKDANGTVYEVQCWQNRIDTTGLADAHKTYDHGLKEFRLADGRRLNWIDDNTFEIAGIGVRLTRI